jgi:ribose transport system permease protein
MSSATHTEARQTRSTFLLVPILLLFALLVVAVLRSPSLISSDGIGSAIIVTTPLVLATYALMVVAIAGRGTVDLSVGPLLGFINVTLIQLYSADLIASPLAFFAWAIAVGIAYQLLMGLVIVFVRVQPIIVALSGYLALSGINLVILPRPGGISPDWMQPWGLGTSVLSPVLAILVLVTAALLLIERTAFFGHLRMMGFDERSAYTSGVRVALVRLGAHVLSGILVGFAALTFTALIGSGDPTQGTTFTLIAITALVLGGTSLAGGRGGTIGALLGGVNLFLVGYVLATFNFGAVQGFVTDLAYGVILVASLLLTLLLPWFQRRVRGVSPFLVFVVLAIGFASVMLHVRDRAPVVRGQAAVAETAPAPSGGATPGVFIFEDAGAGPEISLTPTQRLAGLAALILVVFAVVARVMVTESRGRRMSPFLYASLSVIILVGAWLLAETFGTAAPQASSPTPVPGVSAPDAGPTAGGG